MAGSASPARAAAWLIKTTAGNLTLFDTVSIPNPRFTAALIAIAMLLILLWFLYKTWTGRALRAVAPDRQAAAVTGINPDTG